MKKIVLMLFVMLMSISLPKSMTAAEGIELYTPYTGISVTPGESIRYTFEILNHTSNVQQVTVELEEKTNDWEYTLSSDGWHVQSLSIKPNDIQEFDIEVVVPLEVEKGLYQMKAVAQTENGLTAERELTVNVTEEGTFASEFTSDQLNLEGHSDSTFSYNTTITNRTADEQHYALLAQPPNGWHVDFTVDGQTVTAVTVESNSSQNVTVNVTPATTVSEESYEIPIVARNENTSAELTLEAVITGSYDIELTTPSGRLSDSLTAGRSKTIELIVENTGSATLTDISLSASQPHNWDITFDKETITVLEAGESELVKATITASRQAIAGDYVVDITANAPEVNANTSFRMSVKTSLLWGWVSILTIAIVIGGIYFLIRKYGRR
ncbi:NEW3 domain-containing protein [Bacillus sp. JCM 19034]|uniref:COG1470 family protein n=1 Tax=Bacillus sp. JCM 19034 TaxID=1481928 RepID=UPI000B17518B|nr:NEW3 domain-containing protein [Bacillus sp. JCM 19034]